MASSSSTTVMTTTTTIDLQILQAGPTPLQSPSLRRENQIAVKEQDAESIHTASTNEREGENEQAPEPLTETLDTEENVAADQIVYPTGIEFYVVIMALALALVLVGLDFSILSTAVPSITTHFGKITDVGWYYSGYRLTSCAFQFMFGKIYTVFSIKRVFLCALVIFEIGSFVSGIAPTSAAVVVGRALSGLGCAGIISGCFTMVTRIVPLRQRPLLGGFGAGVEGVASMAGPLLGGVLTDKLSWRWCFYINIPLGALTFFLILIYFHNPHSSPDIGIPLRQKVQKLDLLGTVIFVPSITSLLLALQWGGSNYGWGNARIIVLLILVVLLMMAFAWWQVKKGDDATLPPRIFRQRSLVAGMWFSMCNNSALNVVEYYIPIYYQTILGLSATRSGILILPFIIGSFFGFLSGGSLVSLLGYYTPFMLLTSVLTPIFSGLLTTTSLTSSLPILLVYQGFLGFGGGVGFQAPQVAAQTILEPDDVPIGMAAVIFAQNFGPAVWIPVAQSVFEGKLRDALSAVVVPGLGGGDVLSNVGLLDLRDLITDSVVLDKVLRAFDGAVVMTFVLAVALSGATLMGSGGMEWRSIKRKKA